MTLLAPLLALILYPKAKWLFMVGLAALVLIFILIKRFPTPEPNSGEIADLADTILQGRERGWDVDDYESLNPRDPSVCELWMDTLRVGLPEEWASLDEEKKSRLRANIERLRELDKSEKSAAAPRS